MVQKHEIILKNNISITIIDISNKNIYYFKVLRGTIYVKHTSIIGKFFVGMFASPEISTYNYQR